ncbi:protein phosphatase 1 regulatory subunit 1C-like [Scyliorhinus canicula]|uniref:protein phosphatase 1 regulatory subunit 1C-like n=1 Tax=Scyliorhinus canicula TaxID=7830 RepID=UPI0018F5D243|nr:protein phosphatase 1 regulatory subunit 1C-like [Scyliorhinus canicula]XP_038672979.1 protein phosphatase 1 regulatory subunit 1C-like [Scyliorhinus canicula]
MANDPRKIQFTEPVLDLGLDPQMAEQIRRRRPTPAILMIPHQHFSGTPDEKKVTVCQVKVSKMPSHKEKRRSFPITATVTDILESEFGDDSPDTACCSGQQGIDCPVSEHSLAGKGNETA